MAAHWERTSEESEGGELGGRLCLRVEQAPNSLAAERCQVQAKVAVPQLLPAQRPPN